MWKYEIVAYKTGASVTGSPTLEEMGLFGWTKVTESHFLEIYTRDVSQYEHVSLADRLGILEKKLSIATYFYAWEPKI